METSKKSERREVVFGAVRDLNSNGGIDDRAVLVRMRGDAIELQCCGQIAIVGGSVERCVALEGSSLRVATYDALITLRILIAARRAEIAMAPIIGSGLARHAAANALGAWGIMISLGDEAPTRAQLWEAFVDSVRTGARAHRGLEAMGQHAESAALVAVDALRDWRWA